MQKLFKRAAVRHFLQTVVSVVLAVGLSSYMPPEAAHAIGNAAGAVVGGA